MGSCNSKADEYELQVHPKMSELQVPKDANEMLGWLPDLPDHRDHFVTFKAAEPEKHFVKKKEGTKARKDS